MFVGADIVCNARGGLQQSWTNDDFIEDSHVCWLCRGSSQSARKLRCHIPLDEDELKDGGEVDGKIPDRLRYPNLELYKLNGPFQSLDLTEVGQTEVGIKLDAPQDS